MDILKIFNDQVGGALAKQASSFLGESESGVNSVLNSAVPSLLGSLISKGSNEDGASGILDMIGGLDSGLLDNIGSIFGGGASSVNGLLNSGGGILNGLLGNNMGSVVDLISKVSGVGSGNSSSLLKMVAPFLLSVVGKQVMNKGPKALMDLLAGQKSIVSKALPSGMGSLLGLSSLGKVGEEIKDVVEDAVGTVGDVASKSVDVAAETASTGFSWLKAALPLLLIGVAIWYFVAGPGSSKVKQAAETVAQGAGAVVEGVKDGAEAVAEGVKDGAEAVAEGAGELAAGVGNLFNNVNETAKAALDKITFTAGSAGSQIMDYIKGGFKGDASFRFGSVNFATGSPALTKESMTEIDNLAAILKTYPDLKIIINGYTDNQGDPSSNQSLSQARAAAVQARLLGQGIANDRMTSKGYGEANPVASNETAEGRAQNRRIEVVITN